MNESQPRTEGRVSNLVSAIKKLVYEDALIACFFLVLVVPVAWILVQALGAGNYNLVIICVAVESGLAIFMFIPLVITKKRKDTANQIDGFRNDAMLIEAKRRASVDKNKQKRFNDVIDAKIGLLKAQQDFILSQSDRHERRLLAQLSEDLGKFIKEGPALVKRDECMGNVTKILEELNSVHINYDEVLKNLEEIQSYVIHKSELTDTSTPKPEPEPEPKGTIKTELTITDVPIDEIKADPERYKLRVVDTKESPPLISTASEEIDRLNAVLKNKNEDIAGLVKDLEGGSKNYNLLQADYDKVKAEKYRLQEKLEAEKSKDSLTDRIKKTVNLKILSGPKLSLSVPASRIANSDRKDQSGSDDPSDFSKESGIRTYDLSKDVPSILQGALEAVDKMSDNSEQLEPKTPDSSILAMDQPNNELTAKVISGIPILEKQAKTSVWVCKCKRENEMSKIRCSSCGAGRPILPLY